MSYILDHSHNDKSAYKTSESLRLGSEFVRPPDIDITKLVNAVRRYSYIYDSADVRHTHRDIVNDAWQNIARELSTTQFYAKAKWTNLRSNFTREMRKLRSGKRTSSGQPVMTSRWKYFNTLSFLCDFVVQKPNDDDPTDKHTERMLKHSRLMKQERKSERDYASIEEVMSIEAENITGEEIDEFKLDEAQQEELKACKSITEYVDDNKSTASSASADIDGEGYANIGSEREIPLTSHNVTESDSDYHFLLSLLPRMRGLHPHFNMLFRVQVQQALYQMVTKKQEEGSERREEDYEEYCTFT